MSKLFVLLFIGLVSVIADDNQDNTLSTYLTLFPCKPDNKEVTYPGIGHFTTHDFYDPEYRKCVKLPQSPESINTKFLLHTRKNWNNSQELKQGDLDAIKKSNFNSENPIKFLVHGFMHNVSGSKDWMRPMKNEFLKANDYNIFIVDWSKGDGWPYEQATANTRVVGPVIALFINDLKSLFGIDVNTVHILGHSLGAHTAGYAGERLNGTLGRITGLDPAGPDFRGLKWPQAKLDPTDAQFVDAIHTGAPVHWIIGLGMNETSGHLDFYPNGGKNQPGCDQSKYTIITDGSNGGFQLFVGCDHNRVLDLYLTTINHKQNKGVSYQCQDYESFLAGQCIDCADGSKCAVLGEEAEESRKFKDTTKGTRFFLRTTDKFPYFTNEYEPGEE